jgi:hypothetical protein
MTNNNNPTVDRDTFDAMRTACTALDVTIDDLQTLDTAAFAALFDAFAAWYRLLPGKVGRS